jgi:hypothetical protein
MACSCVEFTSFYGIASQVTLSYMTIISVSHYNDQQIHIFKLPDILFKK